MKKLNEKRKGFTLVELMVVMAIIGILLAMLLPSINGYRDSANKISAEASISGIQSAILSFEVANDDTFDASTDSLDDYFSTDVKIAAAPAVDTWGITFVAAVEADADAGTAAKPAHYKLALPTNSPVKDIITDADLELSTMRN